MATETSFVKILSKGVGKHAHPTQSLAVIFFLFCAHISCTTLISLLPCVGQESLSSSEVVAVRSGPREAALYHGEQEVLSIPHSLRGRNFAANELVWQFLSPPTALPMSHEALNIFLNENSQRPQCQRRADSFFSASFHRRSTMRDSTITASQPVMGAIMMKQVIQLLPFIL